MRLEFAIRLPLAAAALCCSALSFAAPSLPAGLALAVHNSGLPLKSFGLYAEAVDGDPSAALAALNAEQPFLLGSTAKLITTLAALDLLGAEHRWRSRAYASAPLANGRLVGDLVIVGSEAGMSPTDLRRWFKSMRSQGLAEVSGRIVLQNFSLLHDSSDPAQAAASAEEASPGGTPEAREYLRGALAVAVRPGSGAKAEVSLTPRPLGMLLVNDVLMGGGCTAWASWRSAEETGNGAPQLWVRGRWDASCGKQQIAFVRPPPTVRLAPAATLAASMPRVSTARMVATLWAEAGGKLRGRVVDGQRPIERIKARIVASRGDDAAPREFWASEFSTPLADLIRDINKTSNNQAARKLLLSLGDVPAASGALRSAQQRVHGWLRSEGLADGALNIDIGSGQSRAERGTPRAMVQLLHNAWSGGTSQAFIDSLPIAGVDGTLIHRMRSGLATGHAYLKTGTLSDTRALAGYVRAKSGKVYAVAALANHAEAARATPALDAFIEWVARNG